MTPCPAQPDSVPQHGRCDAAIPAQPAFQTGSQAGCALFLPWWDKVIPCRHALFAWDAVPWSGHTSLLALGAARPMTMPMPLLGTMCLPRVYEHLEM